MMKSVYKRIFSLGVVIILWCQYQTLAQVTVHIKHVTETRVIQGALQDNLPTDLDRFPLISYSTEMDWAKGLKLGDRIPDSLWDLPLWVVNNSAGKDTVYLRNYKHNKLIVLDFWAKWCAPCVRSVEKWLAIQREFPEDVFVLPVQLAWDYQAEPFAKNRGWNTPVVIGEGAHILNRHFHIRDHMVGKVVLIKDGVLLAMPGPNYGIEIDVLISGRNMEIPSIFEGTYHDASTEVTFDVARPLFLDGNGGDGSTMLFQSIFSRRIEGHRGEIYRPSPNQIMASNQTVEALYKEALRSEMSPLAYSNNFIQYEVDDELRYRLSPIVMLRTKVDSLRDPWYADNLYCFNLVLPEGSSEVDVNKRMLHDLNDFFGRQLNLNTQYEYREVMTLTIVQAENYKDIAADGGESEYLYEPNKGVLNMQNSPLYMLVNHLNMPFLKLSDYPIVDATGIYSNVNLKLFADFKDLESIREALNQNGLDLIEKVSRIKVIVFKYADDSKVRIDQ